ncbi:COX15/CtaA family protein [Schumannella luteola]
MKAVFDRLPSRVDARIRVFAIATLVAQILIVGTGGAVRLTGSGLGCPTWPRCTAESFVTTPEMGIHGIIEFGNRLLTFVLVAIAIITFVLVLRIRRERRDLFVLALLIGLYVPIQAIIGGITVLTNLNPYVVGLHFLASVVLVSLSAVLVYRVFVGPRGDQFAAPRWYRMIAHITSAFVAITILVGILVTGSGPHAGDGGAARNGLDSEFLQHVHSWPAYATLAATLALVAGAWRLGSRRLLTLSAVLLAVEGVQILVGLAQANLGLPEVLVGIHMVLACCLAAAITAVVCALREPRAEPAYASAS